MEHVGYYDALGFTAEADDMEAGEGTEGGWETHRTAEGAGQLRPPGTPEEAPRRLQERSWRLWGAPAAPVVTTGHVEAQPAADPQHRMRRWEGVRDAVQRALRGSGVWLDPRAAELMPGFTGRAPFCALGLVPLPRSSPYTPPFFGIFYTLIESPEYRELGVKAARDYYQVVGAVRGWFARDGLSVSRHIALEVHDLQRDTVFAVPVGAMKEIVCPWSWTEGEQRRAQQPVYYGGRLAVDHAKRALGISPVNGEGHGLEAQCTLAHLLGTTAQGNSSSAVESMAAAGTSTFGAGQGSGDVDLHAASPFAMGVSVGSPVGLAAPHALPTPLRAPPVPGTGGVAPHAPGNVALASPTRAAGCVPEAPVGRQGLPTPLTASPLPVGGARAAHQLGTTQLGVQLLQFDANLQRTLTPADGRSEQTEEDVLAVLQHPPGRIPLTSSPAHATPG